LDLDQIADALDELGDGAWVWGVHQESSTGLMNALPELVTWPGRAVSAFCADCVSAWTVPVDLSEVYLARGQGQSVQLHRGHGTDLCDQSRLTHLNTDNIPSYSIRLRLRAWAAVYGSLIADEGPVGRVRVADDTPKKAQARFEHYAKLGRSCGSVCGRRPAAPGGG